VRELGLFAENANAVNRLIQRHMSINEVRTHSTRDILRDGDCDDDDYTAGAVDNDVSFQVSMFQLGMSDDDVEDDHGLGVWSEDESDRPRSISISMPGNSKLARRRQGLRHRPSVDSIDSGHLSGCSPPTSGISPVV